jgi:hypothetical protein
MSMAVGAKQRERELKGFLGHELCFHQARELVRLSRPLSTSCQPCTAPLLELPKHLTRSGYIQPVDSTATQHDGTEDLAINDGLVRRFLSLFALNVAARFSRSRQFFPCVPVSKQLIIKTGPFVPSLKLLP